MTVGNDQVAYNKIIIGTLSAARKYCQIYNENV